MGSGPANPACAMRRAWRCAGRSPAPVLVALAALWLAACATTSKPGHESQRDPGTDFGAYRSFGWRASLTGDAGDEPMRMLDVNIRNAIKAELISRGYVEDDAAPDFLVTYTTARKDTVKSNPFRVGIGVGSWGGNVGGSVNVGSPSVKSYQEGELVVHVIDRQANREVWYGTVSGEVDQASLDEPAVARAVAIAMQDFPRRNP